MKLATTRGQMMKWLNFVFSYFHQEEKRSEGRVQFDPA